MPPFKETKKPTVKQDTDTKLDEPTVDPTVEEPKIEEPKIEEPKIEEPKLDEPKTFTVKKVRCSSSIYMVNPFTGDRFLPNDEVEATLDSWLECQIKAGLVQPC